MKKKRGTETLGPPLRLIGCFWFLEVDPETQFHLTCGVNRAGDPAKGCVTRETQAARIRWLVVVKDVSELHRERRAHAFRELDVLGERRVHIPPV